MEVTFEYWNKLATQIIFISSLLGGFSILVIANLLISDLKTRLSKYIMVFSTLAASLFLVSIFAWTSVMMMTTVGYPNKVVSSDLTFHRMIGVITFLFGTVSLIAMISSVGWIKSKKMGIVTTVIGSLSLILIVLTMANS